MEFEPSPNEMAVTCSTDRTKRRLCFFIIKFDIEANDRLLSFDASGVKRVKVEFEPSSNEITVI